MGWKWEVNAWVAGSADMTGTTSTSNVRYSFELVYAGESLVRALLAARKAKRGGAGMVKVEWR